MTVSISKLEELMAGWPKVWAPAMTEDGWSGCFDFAENDGGPDCVIDGSPDSDYAEVFVETVVAQHNAIPALIEVTRAALAYMAANDGDAIGNAYHRARSAANDALRAALAKVAP